MRLAKRGRPGRKRGERIAAVAIGLALLFASQAGAEPLAKPSGGEIILSVAGAIANRNGDGQAFFDLALLESLPQREIVTETPWTKGRHRFTGVPLEALMARVGAQGKTITAEALNDYAVDLPLDDGKNHGALVVYFFDGQPMLPSDKGPLWILYPFSTDPKLRSETYYQRAVWNLFRMTVH